MSIRVHVDIDPLRRMVSPSRLAIVQRRVTERAKQLMEPHVPKEYGALRGNVTLSEKSVRYNVNYAGYVYPRTSAHWTTPGTGGKWDEAMVRSRGQELADFAARQITGD